MRYTPKLIVRAAEQLEVDIAYHKRYSLCHPKVGRGRAHQEAATHLKMAQKASE